ncbi:MAG: sensor histidine kinase, partial [Starkeya sp.]|nr:sensor histidine kinase [Starkeya sp.]
MTKHSQAGTDGVAVPAIPAGDAARPEGRRLAGGSGEIRASGGRASSGSDARRGFHLGLSGKLLAFTLAFVLLAEVLILVPAVAAFRLNWLSDRLASARTAALVLDAAPDGMISPQLTQELLRSVGAITVALKRDDTRRLLASSDMPPEVDHHADVRDVGPLQAVREGYDTLLAPDGRII